MSIMNEFEMDYLLKSLDSIYDRSYKRFCIFGEVTDLDRCLRVLDRRMTVLGVHPPGSDD